MSDWLDDKLGDFIPGYNDIKNETEKKIGTAKEQVFETCLVRKGEFWNPAYLIDADGAGNAIVFIPVAPNFSYGEVALAPPGTYKKLKIDSSVLNSYLGRLGKGLVLPLEIQPNPAFQNK